jgi:hypothetical protein
MAAGSQPDISFLGRTGFINVTNGNTLGPLSIVPFVLKMLGKAVFSCLIFLPSFFVWFLSSSSSIPSALCLDEQHHLINV